MVKRFGAAVLAALLLLALLLPLAGAETAASQTAADPAASSSSVAGETRIWDECGLLGDDEKTQIQSVIDQVQTEYQMDCGVLTTQRVPKNRSDQTEEQTMAYPS